MAAKIVLFLLFFFIGSVATLGYFFLNQEQNIKPIQKTTIAQPTEDFSIARAPKNSLKAEIMSMSGIVKWESRTATEPAEITTPIAVQQGERIITGNGNVKVVFKDTLHLSIFPKSDISFIQTLPEHIVFLQPAGKVQYENITDIPVSVRSHHLIADIAKGIGYIEVQENSPYIVLSVEKGRIKAGFNNLENVTQVVTIEEGKKYIFDDDKREGEIK